MIYSKKIWTSQPQGPSQINWGNPLTAGLTDWIDLRPLIARSALPTGKNISSQASAITSSAGPGGVGLRFPGGTTNGRLTVGGNTDYIEGTQSWLIIASVRSLANSAVTSNVLLSKHDPSSSKKGFSFYCDSSGSGLFLANATTGAGTAAISFDPLKFPVCVFGGSLNPSSFRVAANGRVSADVTTPASFFINSDFPLNIGDSVDSYWNTFDGVIYAVFGWVGTALAPTQLAEVTRNPWQLFAPQTKTIIYLGSAPSEYTLSANSDSYSLTGAAAELIRGKALSADSGSYSLVGSDATLNRTRSLSADSGSYNLMGSSAELTINRSLSADSGAYNVTGAAATLTQAKVISADAGSYVLDGQAASFIRTYNLLAAAGAFNLTGSDASLLTSRSFSADSGAYSIDGAAATLTKVSASGYPDPGDVREGVVYGPGGIYVGTLKVGGKVLYIFDD